MQQQSNATIAGKLFTPETVRRDFLASFVLLLVAMPLGLGIALASGAPIVAGIISCAIGGIVAGLIGGAPLQVSGPAAGLTIVVYGFIQTFGWQVTLAITVFAGIIQWILGALKISRTCLAISPAVVHGMLAGIGIVIVLAQLHIVLGGSPNSSAWQNLRELPQQIIEHHSHATVLGLLTILIMVAWEYGPRKLRAVPGALVAVLVTTLISNLYYFDVRRVTLPDHLFVFSWPTLPADINAFAIAAVTLAMVASVESLLCAVATDKMHRGPRADLDRELKAQGITNIVAGSLGGLPVTGVIVRSSANIAAGARTRLSAILHGVWVILFTLLLANWMERIPIASLAGLLVYVGIRLVNVHHIRELRTHREAVVYAVTVLGVTFLNLLAGVALGIAVAVVVLLRRLANNRITVENRDNRWHARIEGALTFLSVPKLTAALSSIPAKANVEVDLAVDFLDHGAFDALHAWRIAHEANGGRVDFDEVHENWYEKAAAGDPLTFESKPSRAATALQTFLHRRNASHVSDLLNGFLHFRKNASVMNPLLRKLADEGQQPNVLFICCADSRLVPHYMTATNPGDLFKLRNIGNLVPKHSHDQNGCNGHDAMDDSSVAAAVDYALGALKVRNIVVCGHSGCGAMSALLKGTESGGFSPGITKWLGFAEDTVHRYRQEHEESEHTPEAVNNLARINVLVQLEHLREYPSVRQALAEGKVNLFGWYFDIGEAQLYAWSAANNQYLPVQEETLATLLPDQSPEPPGNGIGAIPINLSQPAY